MNFSFSDVKYIIVGNENNRKEVQGVLAKQTEDCSHIVILTKQQVLGDIVGNNHNEERESDGDHRYPSSDTEASGYEP